MDNTIGTSSVGIISSTVTMDIIYSVSCITMSVSRLPYWSARDTVDVCCSNSCPNVLGNVVNVRLTQTIIGVYTACCTIAAMTNEYKDIYIDLHNYKYIQIQHTRNDLCH